MKRASESSDERQRFGRYELLFELAKGGMARVFLARQVGDGGFERLVAVKRMHPHLAADPDVFSMACDEARLTGLLHHPNVASVIDVLDASGELLLVQEYVEGFSLSSLLRRHPGPLPLPIASRIAIDALRGLDAAHEAVDLLGQPLEIVHRDLSPQNLIVGTDGNTRVIDFGIARAEGRMTATKTGIVKGKVVYMAPEQLDGGAVDRRADLFAVGAVLFELVAGRSAFDGSGEAAHIARVLLGDVDLSPVVVAAPKLAPVLERALARRPAERFATAREFARALAAAEPPASDGEVCALVRARGGDSELALRRDRIREHLGEAGEDAGEGAVAGFRRSQPTLPSEGAASGRRRNELTLPPASAWLWAGLSALVLGNVVAWYGFTRTASPRAELASGAAAALSALSLDGAPPVNPPSVESARPPAAVDPSARALPAAPPRASTGGARAPDLMKNPYARP